MAGPEYPDDFEFIAAMEQAKANAEDFARHQRAMAGLETGDGSRHDGERRRRGEIALKDKLESSTALDLLLADPEYAALHDKVSDALRLAENRTEQAIDEANAALETARDALKETMDNANRLADGTKVFRAADERILTADGREVGGEEAESIVWKNGAPSYEDFQRRKQAVIDARARIDALRDYQINVLGPARERMNDQDNPPGADEIRQIGEDVQVGLDQIAQSPNLQTKPQEITNTADVLLPK